MLARVSTNQVINNISELLVTMDEFRPAVIYPEGVRDQPCTHPSHQGFGESIGADFISTSAPDIPGPLDSTVVSDYIQARGNDYGAYDVYIPEYADVYYSMPVVSKKMRNSIFIPLATHVVFGHRSDYYGRDNILWKNLRRTENRISTALIHNLLSKYANGIIAVSNFVAEYIRGVVPETTVRVARPFIEPDTYEYLQDVNPSYEEHRAVVICEHRGHKGVDLLVDAWEAVREEVHDAKLEIIGSGHPSEYEQQEGVTVHGYVENLNELLTKSSLYVHPARIDGFGVSVVEAMYAGLPAVVTSTTGAKSVCKDVQDWMVADPNSNAIAERVVRYFESDINQKRKWGERAHNSGKKFTRSRQLDEFKQAYDDIINKL